MKQSSLSQAIQDLTQDNPVTDMIDTILSDKIDQEFNEVFGPSSKCTLGGFWDPKPVVIDPSVLEQFAPSSMSIIERLYHDLAIHDEMFKHIMDELEPSPRISYFEQMHTALQPCHQGSRRMYGNTVTYPGSPFNV